MTTPLPAWQGNWRERIYRGIRRFGCETVSEFLEKFAGETYSQVVERLGDEIAPVQLQCVQFGEARETRRLREAAMDGLVRVVNDMLPSGWNSKDPRSSAAICAFGAWAGMVKAEGGFQDSDLLLEVWRAIETRLPGIGWHPKNVQVPILQEAFKAGWPKTQPDR